MDCSLEHFDVLCKQVITNLPVLSFSIFFSCHSHVLLILECEQSQGPTLTSVNTCIVNTYISHGATLEHFGRLLELNHHHV